MLPQSSRDTNPFSLHGLWILGRVYAIQNWRKLVAVKERSRLLTGLILIFVVSYATIAFYIFYKGLEFVGRFPALGSMLVERLMFLLFATLFMLLLFSNIVIAYSNLFKNQETRFLVTLPFSKHTVFQWKFLESALLASWAFLFLVAPMLLAYGLNNHLPWHFYLVTILMVGLFIILPAAAGSWCAVNLARYLDRKTFQIVGVVAALALLCLSAWWLRTEEITDTLLETRVMDVLDRLLKKTEFSQFPFLPSYWLSASVVQWSEGAFSSAFFFGLVMISNVFFFGFLACTRMGEPFFEALSVVQSRGNILGQWHWFKRLQSQKKAFDYSNGILERFLRRLKWIPQDVRGVLVKDVKMFWRDTTQWGQTLMLFGLLGVYALNLRHFSQQLTNPFWVHLVSYLNLGACALNLATLTTRFVFPQFSLEGKRIWIIGLAPLGLPAVVKTKFCLAAFTSLIITSSLMLLSCSMLKMPFERTLYFLFAVTLMTFTLNGLAMGLGTCYPNFKEENPSKIVSGFGGTFCLVLSFIYILASVIILGMGSPWGRGAEQSIVKVFSCLFVFVFISYVLGVIPLKSGMKKAENFEY